MVPNCLPEEQKPWVCVFTERVVPLPEGQRILGSNHRRRRITVRPFWSGDHNWNILLRNQRRNRGLPPVLVTSCWTFTFIIVNLSATIGYRKSQQCTVFCTTKQWNVSGGRLRTIDLKCRSLHKHVLVVSTIKRNNERLLILFIHVRTITINGPDKLRTRP